MKVIYPMYSESLAELILHYFLRTTVNSSFLFAKTKDHKC